MILLALPFVALALGASPRAVAAVFVWAALTAASGYVVGQMAWDLGTLDSDE